MDPYRTKDLFSIRYLGKLDKAGGLFSTEREGPVWNTGIGLETVCRACGVLDVEPALLVRNPNCFVTPA